MVDSLRLEGGSSGSGQRKRLSAPLLPIAESDSPLRAAGTSFPSETKISKRPLGGTEIDNEPGHLAVGVEKRVACNCSLLEL